MIRKYFFRPVTVVALSILLLANPDFAIPAKAHDTIKLTSDAGYLREEYGLPDGRWKYIENWSPKTIIFDCTIAAKKDRKGCSEQDILLGPRIEKAGAAAMKWMQEQSLPSPDLLGPVISPNDQVETDALLVFGHNLDGAFAFESDCKSFQDSDRGLLIGWNIASHKNRDLDGFGLLASKLVSDRYLDPQWVLEGVFAHELTHAVQDTVRTQASGSKDTCDPNDTYSRAKFMYEGLADYVANTYVRWHLLKGKELRYPIVDVAEEIRLNSGLTLQDYVSFNGWLRLRSGLFDESNAYLTSSFFRHLSERYLDGDVTLHNAFFLPGDTDYLGSQSDILVWLNQRLGFYLGTDQFGPTLTLAFADIASWPDTKFDGRNRVEEAPKPRSSAWRERVLDCAYAKMSAEKPIVTLKADIVAYGTRCLNLIAEESFASRYNVHAQVYVEARAKTLQEADGLHLGLVQIIPDEPDHDETEAGFVDASNPPEFVKASIFPDFGPKPEERIFSCAATLDRLADKVDSFDEAAKHCLPIRDGPIKQGNGEYVVRWTLPLSLVSEKTSISVALAYVPTEDTKSGTEPREAFIGTKTGSYRLKTSLRRAVNLNALPDEQAQKINPQPVPEASVCKDNMPLAKLARINAITRSFGVADWNAFDFPDDIRSDLNSEIGVERSGFLGMNVRREEFKNSQGMPHNVAVAAAYQQDVEMLRQLANPLLSNGQTLARVNRFRDRDDVVFGFSVDINEYGICNGLTDDDPSSAEDGDRSYFAMISKFDGDEWLGNEPKRWDELQPGMRFDLNVNRLTKTQAAPTGLGSAYDRGWLTILDRGEDWIRIEILIKNRQGAERSFEATLPALEYFTWDSRRQIVKTVMQQYYLERWRNEQLFEYRGKEADAFGREISNTVSPAANVQSGSTNQCNCSCDGLNFFAGEFEKLSRPSNNFAMCSGQCCNAYKACPDNGKQSVRELKNICEW